jgi:Holliday junction DNA helicase RuvB
MEKPGDLAAMLTSLQAREVLFIDEIHRMSPVIEEILYPAMEDFKLDIVIGKGPGAKSHRLPLPHFTVVGATTRLALLSGALRSRFGAVYRLDFYSNEAMTEIVSRAAGLMKVPFNPTGAYELASRARGTPRVGLRLLKWARDYAQARAGGTITEQVANEALDRLGIDKLGLDDIDRRIC